MQSINIGNNTRFQGAKFLRETIVDDHRLTWEVSIRPDRTGFVSIALYQPDGTLVGSRTWEDLPQEEGKVGRLAQILPMWLAEGEEAFRALRSFLPLTGVAPHDEGDIQGMTNFAKKKTEQIKGTIEANGGVCPDCGEEHE